MAKSEKEIDVTVLWNHTHGHTFTAFICLAYLASRGNVNIIRYNSDNAYRLVYFAQTTE